MMMLYALSIASMACQYSLLSFFIQSKYIDLLDEYDVLIMYVWSYERVNLGLIISLQHRRLAMIMVMTL